MSDGRARFGSRSILVNLTEESSDRRDNCAGTCAVDQIESVTDAWQFDITHGRRGHGSELLDEHARLANGNEAVTASVNHEKRWRGFVDPIHRRCSVEHLGVANLRALDDYALEEVHEGPQHGEVAGSEHVRQG